MTWILIMLSTTHNYGKRALCNICVMCGTFHLSYMLINLPTI